jgi:sugar fermentation stimulation protein A
MEGMVVPGARVWISDSHNPARKVRFTWELIELDGRLMGANTALPNRLARAVLEARVLPGLSDFEELRAEVPFGRGHRVDFVLTTGDVRHHLEVKNCHLVYPDGYGYFPDSSSERASAHVNALARLVAKGVPATVLFTVQRADAVGLRPSALHDPPFARAVRAAARAGVSFRCVQLEPTLEGFYFRGELPVDVGLYDSGPLAAFSATFDATSGWERKDGRFSGRTLQAAKARAR